MKPVLKRFLFVFPFAILFILTGCLKEVETNYIACSEFFVVRESKPTTVLDSWKGQTYVVPQLDRDSLPAKTCMHASFIVNYDYQPENAKYLTATSLDGYQQVRHYESHLRPDSSCLDQISIPTTVFATDATSVVFFSDMLFGGARNTDQIENNYIYRAFWTTESISGDIPILYMSASRSSEEIGSNFAIDMAPFISACSGKVENKKLTFHIKYFNGYDDIGELVFKQISINPISISVTK